MQDITAESAPKQRSHLVRRLLLTVAAVITLFHMCATALWAAPPSAARDLVPGDLLTQYMIPVFGQSWSVFAPEPINGDYYFEVRALLGDEQNSESTEWISATTVEQSRSQYHLFPPRSAYVGVRLASDVKQAWDDLTDEQREIASFNYFKGDDAPRRLASDLGDGAADYAQWDSIATAYATQVAYATWGEEDVRRVQFRVSRQNVVPFEARNDPNAERPEIRSADTGWRAPNVVNGQSSEGFAAYFCASSKAACEEVER